MQNTSNYRPQPYLNIPPPRSSSSSSNPTRTPDPSTYPYPTSTSTSTTPYAFEINPHGGYTPLATDTDYPYSYAYPSPDTAHPSHYRADYAYNPNPNILNNSRSLLDVHLLPPTPPPPVPPRPTSRNRARSVYEPPTDSEFLAFPEPQVFRSSSQRVSSSPSPHPQYQPLHRSSRSDAGHVSTHARRQSDLPPPPPPPHPPPQLTSVSTSALLPLRTNSPGSASSHYQSDESDSNLAHQLSNFDLTTPTALYHFQTNTLPPPHASADSWHQFVPASLIESLGPKEVQRQSSFFELIGAERDYVRDLELVEEVFIQPLKTASPPIIPPTRLPEFLSEVFLNLADIRAHHQRMLVALFKRQSEQHPVMRSVADIILDTCLTWRNAYETYIKHYPLAEARHRSELKHNPLYQPFLQSQTSQHPLTKKRDLLTFITRPVTRLPRLSLVLETIRKNTQPAEGGEGEGGGDLETLPLILTILSDFVKSTQPGIVAAESKVKFWSLCESLEFQKGEIIDMDLYDDSRTLVYSGTLARRQRTETDWHGWNDYFVALLDNFLILTREETKSNGVVKRHVGSRPIPLEFLRIGEFGEDPENRKVSTDDGGPGCFFESLVRFRTKPLFPFTVYHASAKATRRYTLYAASEALRQKWKDALVDGVALHKARQDGNMWFVPQSVNDAFFRTVGTYANYNSGARFSGKVTSAVAFSNGRGKFIAVGCSTGIFVAVRGDSKFQRVLPYSNPSTMIALQDFNKFIVQHEASLFTFSLELLARVAQGQAPLQSLDATMEKLTGHDGSVMFTRCGKVGNRTLLIFATRKLLQVTVHALEAVNLSNNLNPRRNPGSSFSFRPFGGPFYIPRDAYDVTPLVKTIGVSTEKGIVILDPTNTQKSVVTIVPEFKDASTDPSMADLKARCDAARPLGLLRCHATELLVVYDTIGCYITKYGAPSRSSGYIRWETKVTSFAHRGNHVLLFSPDFVEVRNINTGRLVQVIEGTDQRLLHCGQEEDARNSILIAMKGSKDDQDGVSDKITELVETVEIATPSTATAPQEHIWDEWDMPPV